MMAARGEDNTTLARAIDVTPTAVGNYVKGRVPRAEELLRLAQHYRVQMEELLGGTATTTTDDSIWKHRALSAEQRLAAVKEGMQALLRKI